MPNRLKVEPMLSPNGIPVKDHFIVDTEFGKYYQGLRTERSIIAFIDAEGKVTLDRNYWHYPDPIEKNRERFLNEDDKVTERKVQDGEYQLADLN